MDKTSQKVTKDPKCVEQGKKSYETRMKKLKEQILEEHQLPTPSTSSSTCDQTLSTFSSTCDPTPSTSFHATKSNDTFIYGIGILGVYAIGVCAFFTYNTFQPKIKKQANGKQDQPPKRHHIL